MKLKTAIIITALFALFDLSVPLWAGWYVDLIDMDLVLYSVLGSLILFILQIGLIMFAWGQYVKYHEQKNR